MKSLFPQFSIFSVKKSFKMIIGNFILSWVSWERDLLLSYLAIVQHKITLTDYRGFSGGVPRVIRKVMLGKSVLVSNV